MDWLAQNWIWVLFGIAFVAMHLFGHGGHGAHGPDTTSRRDAGGAAAPWVAGVRPAEPINGSSSRRH